MKDREVEHYINRHLLSKFVLEKENEILQAYKVYCSLHPLDREVDKLWEQYSFWTQARRLGRVEEIKSSEQAD